MVTHDSTWTAQALPFIINNQTWEHIGLLWIRKTNPFMRFLYFTPLQWFSKCVLWTSDININLKTLHNCKFSELKTQGVGLSNMCSNKPLGWVQCMPMLENHCSRRTPFSSSFKFSQLDGNESNFTLETQQEVSYCCCCCCCSQEITYVYVSRETAKRGGSREINIWWEEVMIQRG